MPEEGRESWSRRSVHAPEALSQVGPRGSCGVSENPGRAGTSVQFMQSRGLDGRKQKNLYFSASDFSALEQLGDCDPSQTVGSGNREKPKETPQQRGQAWVQTPPAHTSLVAPRSGQGAQRGETDKPRAVHSLLVYQLLSFEYIIRNKII